MRKQITRLGTDTAIYGISTILGRLLNFLLIPFYTNILLPGDLGIVSYVFSIVAFATVLYTYGMESAYFKYSSSLEIGTPKQNFSTPFVSLFSSSIFFSVLILVLQSPISRLMSLQEKYQSVIPLASAMMAFDAMAVIPFASLRMEHRPKVFAAIKFFNIVLNVVLNIVFLVELKMGVTGVFLSGTIASMVTFVLLLPSVVRHFTADVNGSLLKSLLRFALPYIPAGLATQAVQVIDRPILRAMTDDATVGIYQANYRLGIFMMLIVQMYDFAWRPFYFSTAKEPNAKEIFARVLTYLVLFMSVVFLCVSFFIGDIVKISIAGHHLIHPSYWGGLNIVPVVLLGYFFLGVSTNLSAGVYIEKKTTMLPVVSVFGALTNILVNYLLIPSMGILGAAWATLLAYFVMAAAMYFIVQRIYPISYEWGRMIKIFVALTLVFSVYELLPFDVMDAFVNIMTKCFLIGLFLGIMFFMKFFESREVGFIRNMIRRDGNSTDDQPPAIDSRGV